MPRVAKSTEPASRRAILCRELLDLRKDHAEVFSRIDAINSELKAIAEKDGGSFRENYAGVGYVSVTPPKEAAFQGDIPEIVIEAWQGLTPTKREKLVSDGVVKIEPTWSKKSYGQVRPHLF